MLTVEFKGLPELQMRLLTFPNKLANKIVRDAMRKSMKPFEDFVRDMAPNDPLGTAAERMRYKFRGAPYPAKPGTIKRSIKAVRRNKLSNQWRDVWVIRARKGADALKGYDAFYAQLVEGEYQFFRRAFNERAQQTVDMIVDEIKKGIEANW